MEFAAKETGIRGFRSAQTYESNSSGIVSSGMLGQLRETLRAGLHCGEHDRSRGVRIHPINARIGDACDG
jgi:hypothetical protein